MSKSNVYPAKCPSANAHTSLISRNMDFYFKEMNNATKTSGVHNISLINKKSKAEMIVYHLCLCMLFCLK